MDSFIAEFDKRWQTIRSATLSTLRLSLKCGFPDIDDVNRTLSRECEQWFSGSLAAALWFDNLKKEDPQKASRFSYTVSTMSLSQEELYPPKTWWTYIVGILIAVAAYFILIYLTDFGLFTDIIISIGCGVLGYTLCYPLASKQKKNYIESYVNLYDSQLEEYHRQLISILK